MPGRPPRSSAPRRWSRAARTLLTLAMVVVMAGVLGGCRFGAPRDFRNENDRLRRENLELHRQVEQLNERLELRAGELENLRQRLDRVETDPMPEAEPPTLSRIRMGRYSGGVDTNGDGVDDLIRVYLRPLDQEGRVIPVAGRAVLQVVALADDGDPQVLGRREYDPRQFNRAWRSGFTGTHYTLELELPEDVPADVSSVAVRVTLTQAQTGVELTTQQSFRIRRPPPPAPASAS